MKDSSRRSFVKTSAATGLTFTFAGLIRAHGQSGGGNTTWNPEGTFFSTNSGETTTYDPNGTYVTTDPGVTTTWDPDATTMPETTTTTEITTTEPQTTAKQKYFLICTSEPNEGDWGEIFTDAVGAHSQNNRGLAALGIDRWFGCSVGITNWHHDDWGRRCLRTGKVGRLEDLTWSRICAAGVFQCVAGSAPNVKLAPKSRMDAMCDPDTGKISVTNNASGGTIKGTAGGSEVEGISLINIKGNNTKKVIVDVVWKFTWKSMGIQNIDLVRVYGVNFGFSFDADNNLYWEKKCTFVLESKLTSNFMNEVTKYQQMAIPGDPPKGTKNDMSGNKVTTNTLSPVLLPPLPPLYFTTSDTTFYSKTELVSIGDIVADITGQINNGSVKTYWEF